MKVHNQFCRSFTRFFCLFCLFCLFCSLPSLLFSAPILILEEGKELYPIAPYLEVLEDPEKQWTIEDVTSPNLREKFFTPEKTNFGYTTSAYWVRFRIKKLDHLDIEWKMVFHTNWDLQIELYIPSDKNDKTLHWTGRTIGRNTPLSEREDYQHELVFILKQKQGQEKIYYARLQESVMNIQGEIQTQESFIRAKQFWLFRIAFFGGVIFVIIFYNGFLALSLRSTTYLYYTCYVFFFAIYTICWDGIGDEFIWSKQPWLGMPLFAVFVWLTFFFAACFTINFLPLKSLFPFLYKTIWVTVVLIGGASIWAFLDFNAIPLLLGDLFSIILFLTFILAGIICWKKGIPSAKYYFFAWICNSLGMIFEILRKSLFVYSHVFFPIAHIGVILEFILLSIALADQINIMRKEKEGAQEKTLRVEKKANKELSGKNLEIENKNRELSGKNLEIENKNRELSRLNSLKDEFLANTSHELRTPLNGIMNLSEILLEELRSSLTPSQRQNLELVTYNGKRLSFLVNDLLDYSKIRHHELRLQTKSVDVRNVTDMVLIFFRFFPGNEPIELINRILPGLPLVLADENRFQQILHNLVGNALKFTEQGKIELTARIVGDFLELCVMDTGIGIPSEKQEIIFESFEQGNRLISQEYGGTGLGLAITKKLVELQGGKIRVRSTIGEGSTFIFTLPLSKENHEENTKEKPKMEEDSQSFFSSEEFPEKGIKILAVDDDFSNLHVIKNHFSSHDYGVIPLLTGQKSLEWIETYGKPDLLLLDIMMPKMGGFEVCREVRKQFNLADLPIIFLTASHRLSDMDQGFFLGANDYLTKPFRKEELVARVRTHLQVVVEKKRLISLREMSNDISKYKSQEEVLRKSLEKMQQNHMATCSILFQEEKATKEGEKSFLILEKRPDLSVLKEYNKKSGKALVNSLSKDHPLFLFYEGKIPVGSHLLFLQSNSTQKFCFCLFRRQNREPFGELDEEYGLNMIEQFHILEKNITTFRTAEKILVQIHPLVSRISYIKAEGSYCEIFLEGAYFDKKKKTRSQIFRISLSFLDLCYLDKELVKIHKSFLVNPVFVDKAMGNMKKGFRLLLNTGKQVEIEKKEGIPMGKNHKERLSKLFPFWFQD